MVKPKDFIKYPPIKSIKNDNFRKGGKIVKK